MHVEELRKRYSNGNEAVKGLNFRMYPNQIFVLLGHNGAGKSTCISVLTGLLNATEGEATIYNIDLFNDM